MAKNELERVLALAAGLQTFAGSRREFARKKGLHPSALSRILRVAELSPELLSRLASFPVLSRTHLEVIAAAPPEKREQVVSSVREGRSTYALRERRETTGVLLEAATPAPEKPLPGVEEGRLGEVSRALGASRDETLAFALELLMVLWRSGPDRVSGSFAAWRPRVKVAS